MAKCENENKASLVVSYIYLVYMLMDWRENPGWGASRSSCYDLDGLDLICYSMKAKADRASDWLALELGEKPLARTHGHGHVFRVWCSKLTQLSPSVCLTLCNPIDCSMPGFPLHHQLPELAQTHIHCVGDAVQPSHSLSSPSPPAFNLSQHQGLFKWVSSLHQVAKILEFFSFSFSPSNEYSGLCHQGSPKLDFFLRENSYVLICLGCYNILS